MEESTFLKELSKYNKSLREHEEHIARLQNEVQQLQREAIHDAKTALYSPAYLHTRLNEEIVRSERYRHFMSLVLMHVDLQDHHSTRQIIREIKKIGRELQVGLTRRTDIIALYRKRQMIIMLPETDQRGADILIQRYQMMFPNNGRQVNYAILTYPNDATNVELLLGRLQEMSEDMFRGARPVHEPKRSK